MIVMFASARNWIYSKEGWDDLPEEADEPTWIGIGWIVATARRTAAADLADPRRDRRASPRDGKGAGLLKAAMVIAWIVLAAALVAVWAMSGKPD